MPKRSSLAKKITGQISPVPDIRYPDHLKTGHKKCPRNDHLNTGRFGIRMLTVHPKAGPSEIRTVRSRTIFFPSFEWLD